MTDDELVKVVARIQAGDNRSVDSVTIAHWRETIGHLSFDDAYQAVVMHFSESTEYLTAAHISANARRIRTSRNVKRDEYGNELDPLCQTRGPKYAVNDSCILCGADRSVHAKTLVTQ